MEMVVILACIAVLLGIGYSVGSQVGFQRGRDAAMREMEAYQRRVR
jgi:Tfp pilus assembly protein FimT